MTTLAIADRSKPSRNEAHNETLGILEYLPRLRWVVFLIWAVLIGHRSLPGAAQCVRLALMGQAAWGTLAPVVVGRWLGLRTVLTRPMVERAPGALSFEEPAPMAMRKTLMRRDAI